MLRPMTWKTSFANFMTDRMKLKAFSVALAACGCQAAAEGSVTCAEALNGPVLGDALTRDEGKDWRDFVDSGLLIGVACDPDELDAYFEAGGWTIGGRKSRPPDASHGPFGPPGKEYFFDFSMGYAFCEPRGWFSIIRKKRCANSIGIAMFEGRITHIHGGGNK